MKIFYPLLYHNNSRNKQLCTEYNSFQHEFYNTKGLETEFKTLKDRIDHSYLEKDSINISYNIY